MRRILAAFLLTLTLLAGGLAIPATTAFLPTSQGQGDPKVTVWVNTSSGVYHCPGTRWYGNTKQGKYMSQREAQAAGHRPAYGSVCG